MNWTVITRLAIALALGLIIGTERGWQSQHDSELNRESARESDLEPEEVSDAAAGFRSFGLVGLLGGLAMLLANTFGPILLAAIFLGFSTVVAVSYWLTARRTEDYGITTELALLLTFCLGALSTGGYEAEAVASAVVIAVLLSFKQEMHHYLSKLNRTELLATLQLLLIAMVALPLLPDQNLGPWQAINPQTVGLLVMLIAATGYIGYFAVRLLGERTGLLLTALLGGLVSSTAVTVSFARMARIKQGTPMLLGAGISLAAGTMAVRLLVEIAVVNTRLLPFLVPPISCLAAVPLVAALGLSRLQDRAIDPPDKAHPRPAVELDNPIDLKSALLYGVILTVLFVLVKATEVWIGRSGVYLLSAISGIADVDAVSLSLAASATRGLSEQVASFGILLAVTVNTLVKAGIAIAIGGWRLARWSATILLVALGLGALTLLLA